MVTGYPQMNILLFSPIELPFTPYSRYTGLERLVVEFARELNQQGHSVTLLAHRDSIVPLGVKLLPCEGYSSPDHSIHAEQKAFQRYQSEFYKFDVIHDWGHLHLIARLLGKHMPTLNMLNHAPVHGIYIKSPYNIISWSKWGVWSFKQVYKQNSRYQESIAIDTSIYKRDLTRKRTGRFLTIGRMSPDKGNLRCAQLCKSMGLELDIAGGRGSETNKDTPLTPYEQAILDIADGQQIRFLGEVDDITKVDLMQTCEALLYTTTHAEITSHKVQEAMFCGAPVIVPSIGGLPEIIEPDVNGYTCLTDEGYKNAIKNLDKLPMPEEAYIRLVEKYQTTNVVSNYVKLYEEVSKGLRW